MLFISATIAAFFDPLHWIAGLAAGLFSSRRFTVLVAALVAALISLFLTAEMAGPLQQTITLGQGTTLFLGRTICIGLIALLGFEIKRWRQGQEENAENRLALQERIITGSSLEHFAQMAKARMAIMKAAGDRRPARGTMKCPACERGVLEWFIMPNDHVHAECSSPGCLNWVE